MKSIKIVKVLMFVIGLILIAKSGLVNDFTLSFNQTECYIGFGLIIASLFKRVRLFIKQTFDC